MRCPIRSGGRPSHSGEIRTDARVQKVLTTGARFAGVVLENGEELRAPLGVTCIHPKIAFLDLIGREELPADFVGTSSGGARARAS